MPGEYIAQTLKNIGIKVNQEPMAGFAAWGKRIAAWNFDMSLNWPGDKVDPAVGVSRLYVCDNIKKQAYTNTLRLLQGGGGRVVRAGGRGGGLRQAPGAL